MNWQPIETAPKDREIMLFGYMNDENETEIIVNGQWVEVSDVPLLSRWRTISGDWIEEVTHWAEIKRPDVIWGP